jgi:Ran GTPase-activating protein 1
VPLQHLYLNNNGLGPHAGILIADALSELHGKKEEARKNGQQVPNLETVICGRNRLENGSMAAWAKAFKLHNKIKEIKMVQNGIRQEGISHLLSEGLRHTSQLEVLDLQDNTFTLLGAKALAAVAPGWAELIELGIGDSLLGSKGGVLLAKSLGKGKNTKLKILRLQYNEITASGIKALAEAAEALPVLKKLELNGNKFTEDDESIIALQDLFEARKEKQAGDIVLEDEWGLDSLSDLEEESEGEEEEEEEEEEEDVEEKAEKFIKEAKEAYAEPVAQQKDKDVDQLAAKLGKTAI